ncbi:hypothetical protein L1987_00556 [Smallanthus sonchifolius]|uniref:Uncharacterized protein n=1 Tax=Smallanthus sonchifolius TaxID=185202 RepID=A0ACB9K2N8_9ASTR|nr:hypothetical protein L1987_00556 [Smallanthus sonchifolius]
MATEQKASPATAKSNGKRKIIKDDVPEKFLIARCSSSNSHNHESNGAKSTSKLSEQVEVSGEVIVVDDSAQVSPAANGNYVSKKMEKTKKVKDETEEKEGSLLYQIPMNRVSRIVKSEDPNARITQEAVYIINKG